MSSSQIIMGESSSHNIGSDPCVIAAATPETIWTASSKAKTHLWWTSSSRSTGKPNRRSSRSPGRKRTNMWWLQMQIWMASWRWAGMSNCWGLLASQHVKWLEEQKVRLGYHRPQSHHRYIKKHWRYFPSGGLCSDENGFLIHTVPELAWGLELTLGCLSNPHHLFLHFRTEVDLMVEIDTS